MEIQGVIRNYFEKLCSNKLDNLEKMDKFLDTCELPKLNQEGINHLKRSITQNEIEVAIVSRKRKVSDRVSAEFYHLQRRTNTHTP
jgi:hypothetical protein